ncbi:hypothetical protein F5X98DRAFT_376999 [Xylaria grammica]|nr:hypothetical protein F5X98DRAFT_376999 [Xylaria grammica]
MSSHGDRGSRGRRGSGRGRYHGGDPVGSGPNEGAATGTNVGTSGGDDRLVFSGRVSDFDDLAAMFNRIPDARFTLRLEAVPKGTKRSSTDDGPAAKKMKTKREVPAPPERATCGNCGAGGHRAAFCVKIGRSGWMEACPKCDSTKHLYEACPRRVKGPEDFQYLIFNRQRKPPVKSRMVLGKVIKAEMERAGSSLRGKYEIELPYSSKYARQADRLTPSALYAYEYVGDPKKEAELRIPEPSRHPILVADAFRHNSIARQFWSTEEELFDPEEDGTVPMDIVLKDPHNHIGHPSSSRSAPAGHLPSLSTTSNAFVVPSRSFRHGSSSLAGASCAIELRKSIFETACGNCGTMDHPTYECKANCCVCGQDDHNVSDCQSEEACVCQQKPGHLLKDCDECCGHCDYHSNTKPHWTSRCPAICHYCLGVGHTMGECPEDRAEDRHCSSCLENGVGERYHLPSLCIFNLCPNDRCEDKLLCKQHCKGCGWDKNRFTVVSSGRAHKCQFHKIQGGLTDGRPFLALQCLHDKGHVFRHEDLLAAREHAAAQLQKGKLREGAWPVECPTCLSLAAEGYT